MILFTYPADRDSFTEQPYLDINSCKTCSSVTDNIRDLDISLSLFMPKTRNFMKN